MGDQDRMEDPASSRIFVRGLPPNISEDDFRKHFSAKHSITDAKCYTNRRIGYVGFRTPEDAQAAVKYFNRSYIRMSRIIVELARPIPSQAPTSKAWSKTGIHPPSDHTKSTETSDSRKRKRQTAEDEAVDPKLKQYLGTAKSSRKSNTWSDDIAMQDDTQAKAGSASKDGNGQQSDSDEGYESVPKPSKSTAPRAPDPVVEEISPSVYEPESREDGDAEMEDVPQIAEADPPDADEQAPLPEVSDSDWLRSRTSRLLDLQEDGEEEIDAAKKGPGDVEGSRAQEVAPSKAAAPAQPEPEDSSRPSHIEDHALPAKAKGASKQGNDAVAGGEDPDVAKVKAHGRLFVRNLPYDISEESLRGQFESFGSLEEVHIPIDSNTGAGKGFAHIAFNDPDDAVKAFQELDGLVFQGRLMHVLPGQAKRESQFNEYALSKMPLKKQQQIRKRHQAAASTFNWNSLYMNPDAVLASIADRLGVQKNDVLDPTSSSSAVTQAKAETHLIQETKAFFTKEGVNLDAFEGKTKGDTAILVKNFSYGTSVQDLRDLFGQFGTIRRVLMPPFGTVAIIEMDDASEARTAFKSLAYRKLKESILYLEKAPRNLFSAATTQQEAIAVPQAPHAATSTKDLLEAQATDSTESTTLFVKNLNFDTNTERLREAFKPLDGFRSATVRMKPNPKDPKRPLSMGFGFVEFRDKATAEAAMATMDGYSLEGHSLQIKASHRGMDAAEERRKQDHAKNIAMKKSKIVVKNLPFEATKKDVRELLSTYGQLRNVRVPRKFDNSARGFAFAEFKSAREAETALDALKNTHLLGRRLVLDYAAEDPEDAEEQIERMQQKVGSQMNRVALQNLAGAGRKKFRVGDGDAEEAYE